MHAKNYTECKYAGNLLPVVHTVLPGKSKTQVTTLTLKLKKGLQHF